MKRSREEVIHCIAETVHVNAVKGEQGKYRCVMVALDVVETLDAFPEMAREVVLEYNRFSADLQWAVQQHVAAPGGRSARRVAPHDAVRVQVLPLNCPRLATTVEELREVPAGGIVTLRRALLTRIGKVENTCIWRSGVCNCAPQVFWTDFGGVPDTCRRCGKPLLQGDVRYTATQTCVLSLGTTATRQPVEVMFGADGLLNQDTGTLLDVIVLSAPKLKECQGRYHALPRYLALRAPTASPCFWPVCPALDLASLRAAIPRVPMSQRGAALKLLCSVASLITAGTPTDEPDAQLQGSVNDCSSLRGHSSLQEAPPGAILRPLHVVLDEGFRDVAMRVARYAPTHFVAVGDLQPEMVALHNPGVIIVDAAKVTPVVRDLIRFQRVSLGSQLVSVRVAVWVVGGVGLFTDATALHMDILLEGAEVDPDEFLDAALAGSTGDVTPVLDPPRPMVSLEGDADFLLRRFAEAAAKLGSLTIPDLRRLVRSAHVLRALVWWSGLNPAVDAPGADVDGADIVVSVDDALRAIRFFAERHKIDVEPTPDGVAAFVECYAPAGPSLALLP